ncbi:MAG: tRNA 2-thiouridine(34) synthase MnmA [Syntrophomonadaceae bacterium]|jgi:tRNA-specific 2-thiouridylase|nr:tRNA 2-thiouridine(34) synthase MnmA [Syntrophomonadaceae bacterium]
MKNNPRVLIAMSGGVDSSTAAMLLIQQGFECAGAMMKLFENYDVGVCSDKSCCSLDDAEDARTIALKLGIPFYIFNFAAEFKKQVMEPFVSYYLNGKTPNPCIECNRHLKFENFLTRASLMGYDYMATGHYARITQDPISKRYLLKKGVDAYKDQSYVLYSMQQEQLAHTLFPLGELRKEQVRELAYNNNFINYHKQDSQDICFVRDGNYANFIETYTGQLLKKGRFTDTSGHNLGEHKGIGHYTVGQRKGLGLAMPFPVYVCSINAETNTVTVGQERELYSKILTAGNINLIPLPHIDTSLRVKAKLRYKHQEQPATVRQLDADLIRVEFDQPQRAITKGQAVVLYDEDLVIGGGTIL